MIDQSRSMRAAADDVWHRQPAAAAPFPTDNHQHTPLITVDSLISGQSVGTQPHLVAGAPARCIHPLLVVISV